MWPLRRSVLPSAAAPPARATRPADGPVHDLLAEVSELRLRLDTDFAVAASALDAGAPAVARDVLAGQQQDLAGFEERMLARLRGGTPTAQAPAAAPDPVPAAALDPVPAATGSSPPRRRRLATSRLLPAAPLLAAAAAAAAFASGALVTPGSTPASLHSRAVAASWADVHQLAAQHASAKQVLATVLRLRASLAPLIAAARTDPASAAQALAVLTQARALLLADAPPGAAQALAATEALVQQLAATLPSAPPLPAVSTVLPHLRLTHPAPAAKSNATGSSARPSASPSGSASPTTQPHHTSPPPAAPQPTTSPATAGGATQPSSGQPSAPQPSPSGWQWSPPAQFDS